MEFLVEPMKKDHVASVVALERDCRLSSRGEGGYLKLLEDGRWLLLVARESAKTVAVFSAQMVLDELQIDNIAVAEGFRQKGLGTTLLTKALERAKRKGILTAILEVRSENLAAIGLYRRQGFSVIGRRKDYYHGPPDDALLMSLNLSKHS